MGNYGLEIGSDIAPFAFIVVPIAYNAQGNPTEFVQYSTTTCDPSLASKTLGTAPNPSDIVAAANRFASDPSLGNVEAPCDCQNIAQDVAAAAGAAPCHGHGAANKGCEPGQIAAKLCGGVFRPREFHGCPDSALACVRPALPLASNSMTSFGDDHDMLHTMSDWKSDRFPSEGFLVASHH
jgi:hypothetical protein